MIKIDSVYFDEISTWKMFEHKFIRCKIKSKNHHDDKHKIKLNLNY